MVNNYNLEKSILSTALSLVSYTDVYDIELVEGYFEQNYHKAIVRAINNLKAQKKPSDEFMVLDYLEENKYLKKDEWYEIMTYTPLIRNLYKQYLEELKERALQRMYI